MSSRSKRTSTRRASPSGTSSSSGTSSKGGAGTARASPSRSTSRSTSSSSRSTSISSPSRTTSKGGAGTARASPSRTASRTTTTKTTTRSPSSTTTSKDTTTSSSSDTVTTPFSKTVFNIIPSIPQVSAQTPTISSEVKSVLSNLESSDSVYPDWFNNNIQWVKEGTITNEEFLNAYDNLIQREVITTPIIKEVVFSSPEAGNISFNDITENSVSISWSSNSLPITGFHLVIINEDTSQTIHVLDPLPNMTNTIFSNLDSGTNYKAYLIVVNDIGNSSEVNNSFKTLGVKVLDPIITISTEVQAILTKLDNNDYTYPSWFNNNIKWVNDGTITSNEFLVAFNNLLQTGVIIDKSALPIEDITISGNMVSQSIGAFKLENGYVTGDIIYIAESSFNPYYYNKPLTSIVQIKDPRGFSIILKTNNLNFTATERDERISINEKVGDINGVKIEFYVWESLQNPILFSGKKISEIVCVDCFPPCPINQHRNFNGKCVPDDPIESSLLNKVMGVTAILGTLALLGSKGR